METPSQDQIVEEVRSQWRMLWLERFDDRVRAEGISSNMYPSLFVEKGLVIFATREFKALNLREILTQHGIGNPDRHIPPDPRVGGWGKFIRSTLPPKKNSTGRAQQVREELKLGKKKQQLKKGGRGWLHA